MDKGDRCGKGVFDSTNIIPARDGVYICLRSSMALFGKTAAQWRNENGISIRQEVPQIERLKILREKAYRGPFFMPFAQPWVPAVNL